MTTHEQYVSLGGTRSELSRAMSKALYGISAAAIRQQDNEGAAVFHERLRDAASSIAAHLESPSYLTRIVK